MGFLLQLQLDKLLASTMVSCSTKGLLLGGKQALGNPQACLERMWEGGSPEGQGRATVAWTPVEGEGEKAQHIPQAGLEEGLQLNISGGMKGRGGSGQPPYSPESRHRESMKCPG